MTFAKFLFSLVMAVLWTVLVFCVCKYLGKIPHDLAFAVGAIVFFIRFAPPEPLS